jgi:hypothetical protein
MSVLVLIVTRLFDVTSLLMTMANAIWKSTTVSTYAETGHRFDVIHPFTFSNQFQFKVNRDIISYKLATFVVNFGFFCLWPFLFLIFFLDNQMDPVCLIPFSFFPLDFYFHLSLYIGWVVRWEHKCSMILLWFTCACGT